MKSSVVIATYNGARFISEQLSSIINQTCIPSEIIISDDGSSDNTVEIIQSFIEEYKDSSVHIELLKNEDNHGVCGNFQNAAMHAHGQYVFFCDQDDIWFSNKIERCISVLEKHSEQVLIHNAQILKETKSGSFNPIDRHLLGEYPFDSQGIYKLNGSFHVWPAFYHCVIQGMCMCVKQEYLQSILPFSKGRIHDNWILFCAMADDTILAVKDDLAYYRIHNNNECGISEFKKKRPLIKKISTFDRRGKESVIKQYIWYQDTKSYLGDRPIIDQRIQKMLPFFSGQRIEAISKNKFAATIDLVKAYQSGVYQIDGKILFYHDLWLVWFHSGKNRFRLVTGLHKQLRSNSDHRSTISGE